MASTLSAPTYFSETERQQWKAHSQRFGAPIYQYPFWYWPEGFEDYDYQINCRPFSVRIGSKEIQACAVWNNKDAMDVWFDKAPPFIEDHNGVNLPGAGTSFEIRASRHSPEEVSEQQEKAAHKVALREQWKYLYAVVGFFSAAILIKHYKKKKQI